jgi:hypothetical protein
VTAGFQGALVTALDREALLRSLGAAIEGLLREADEVSELAAKVGPQLRELGLGGAQSPPRRSG